MRLKIPLIIIIFNLYIYQLISWCLKQAIRQGESSDVVAVDYSPRNLGYVAIARKQGVYIYNQTTFQLLGGIIISGWDVRSVSFSKQNNMFAVGYSNQNFIKIYSCNSFPFTQRTISPVTITHQGLGIDFSDDGNKIVVCGNSNDATIINNVNTMTVSTSLAGINGVSGPSQDCQYSPANQIGVVFSNKVVILNSALTQTAVSNLACDGIDFKPGGNAIVGCKDNKGYQILPGTNNNNAFLTDLDDLKAVAYANDGQLFFIGGKQRIGFLFHSNNTMMSSFRNLNEQIVTARFNQDSKNLLVGTKKGYVYLLQKDCQFRCQVSEFYQNKTCFLCHKYIAYCNECTNRTICISCITGFVLNAGKCYPCNKTGCLQCSPDNTKCQICEMSYFLNNVTNLCERCTQYIPYCLFCNASNYCTTCDHMAYFDSTTLTCRLCNTTSAMMYCEQCQNSSRCLSCEVGFFLNSSFLCSRCPDFCISCIANQTCNECIKGFYVSFTSTAVNNSCVRCSTFGCINCNNSNVCLQCQQGKYLHSNSSCVECSLPCSACNASATCFSCINGYYLNSTNSCVLCDSNCQLCNQTGQCLSCYEGFYLNSSKKCSKCSIAWSNCSVCTESMCLLCLQTYYLNATSTGCASCSQMIKNCLTCNDSINCLQCKIGYYQTGLTGNSSCQACSIGCAKCISALICQSCLDGYYYVSGGTCSNCVSPCITCLDSTTCLSCRYGFYINFTNNTCVNCHRAISYCLDCYNASYCQGCQLGYSLNSARSACIKCPNNCTSCSNNNGTFTQCYTCQNGYYLNSSNSCTKCPTQCSMCYNSTGCIQCLTGHYLDSINSKCLKCSDSNCMECTNSTDCIVCSTGYYLQSNSSLTNFRKCVKCNSLMSKCLLCDQNKQCTLCSYGYGLASNKLSCSLCSLNMIGCIHCQFRLDCLACAKGFYLTDADSNGKFQCVKCQESCQVCKNYTQCSYCIDNYYLDNSGVCKDCEQTLEGCLTCKKINSTALNCEYCQEQYYLQSSFTCKLCSQVLSGCFMCENSSYCSVCQTGYYLNATTKKCQKCSNQLNQCQICIFQTSLKCKQCQNGYYLDQASYICIKCQSNLKNCLSCYNVTHCAICQKNTYLVTTVINSTTTNLCKSCDVTMQGCLSCLTDQICLQCQSGYFLDNSTSKCSKCKIKGCQICQQANSTTCITCNSLYIFQPTTEGCVLCNSLLQGCLNCQNYTSTLKCLTCMVGFYKNISQKCELCSISIDGCIRCSSSNTCLQCDTLYLMKINSTNNYSTCSMCSQYINHCVVCQNSSNIVKCLECQSSYYLSSDNLSCHFCPQYIPNCIYCGSATQCIMCQSQYFISNTGTCNKCSSYLVGCYSCLDENICTACKNGYIYSDTTNTCSALTLKAEEPVGDRLKLITYYIDKNRLKHVLFSSKSKFSSANAQNLNILTSVKLSLTDLNQNSYMLTINSYQFSQNGYSLTFWTNNPIDFQQVISSNPQTFKMKIRRLLPLATLSELNMNTNLQMPKSVSTSILPTLDYNNDVKLEYGLNEPQFYASLIENAQSFNSCIYYLFGYVILPIYFLNFAIKTFFTVPTSFNRGDVIPHVISLKMIAISIFPSYYQMVSFCKGFMLFDIPWLNKVFGQYFSQQYDYFPKGYSIFYKNVNIGSTFLLALALILCLMVYKFYKDSVSSQHQAVKQKSISPKSFDSKPQSKSDDSQENKNKKNLSPYSIFWFNIFGFSLIQLTCNCLIAAINTPFYEISIKYIFYLGGSSIYILVLIKILYITYYDFQDNINLIRVLFKSTLLSLCYISPLYMSNFAILLDISLIMVHYRLHVDTKQRTKSKEIYMYYLSHFMVNISLMLGFLINSHLFALVIPILLISLSLLIQIAAHYKQKKSLKINPQRRIQHESHASVQDESQLEYNQERIMSYLAKQNMEKNQQPVQIQGQKQQQNNDVEDYVPTIQEIFMNQTNNNHFFQDL